MGIFIDTYGTSKLNLTNGEIAKKVEAIFDMRPYFIEQRLKQETQSIVKRTAIWVVHLKPLLKHFLLQVGIRKRLVELFTWEKLDFVDQVKAAFGL
jgi:S-adenosylmethionine synthetase